MNMQGGAVLCARLTTLTRFFPSPIFVQALQPSTQLDANFREEGRKAVIFLRTWLQVPLV